MKPPPALRALVLGCALGLAGAALAQELPIARYRTASAPDCVDISSLAVQYDPAPLNRTYMRVQHMGDPDTLELRFQVSQAVTWDVGAYTGLFVPAGSQRGYRDAHGYSAFQLRCAEAGFFINTASFSHAAPLVGQGPNVSVARDLEPPMAAFAQGAGLAIEAEVRVPWARAAAPPVTEGTAQVGFFFYLRDRTSGIVVTQLVGLFENRAPGVNGSGVEGLGHDSVNAFVTSPLAPLDAAGNTVRFVTALPGSARMQHVEPWAEPRRFAALVSAANFRAVLERLRESGLAVSPLPSDYDLLSFGLLGEVFAGTGRDNDVALGASVANLRLRTLPLPRFTRH